MNVRQVEVKTAQKWLENDEAILIDVREPAEHASQKIKGSALHPLGSISSNDISQVKKKILIHCQKGTRGNNACQKLIAENQALDVYNIEGGIEAWQQAGFPVESSGKKFLPLDRQVQLTIGVSVLTFALLGFFVNPAFAFGAAFFGAGLTIAGLTGWCGLAKLMAKMPWNQ
ncbi:MAG: rhodanese [Dehalococcoidia bacterium]|nr:rhodanese [Dehalococcoidia bacterium]HCV00784.1 rhodanese [Dehalococcoidia bacterium]|tara:strand:- start:965 stop:1480 length:516 start_codon:yes stop_codon:yes gene_type:complete